MVTRPHLSWLAWAQVHALAHMRTHTQAEGQEAARAAKSQVDGEMQSREAFFFSGFWLFWRSRPEATSCLGSLKATSGRFPLTHTATLTPPQRPPLSLCSRCFPLPLLWFLFIYFFNVWSRPPLPSRGKRLAVAQRHLLSWCMSVFGRWDCFSISFLCGADESYTGVWILLHRRLVLFRAICLPFGWDVRVAAGVAAQF